MLIIRKDQMPLIYIAIAVWILAGLTAIVKTSLSASQKGTVMLVTVPNTVRLNINGVPYEKARYLVTPIKLPVKPGKVKLKIIRDGYRSHIVNLEGTGNEKLALSDINLVKKPDYEFVSIEITGDKISKPYYVEINRGFLQGETPLVANDLPLRGKHVLEFFPQGPKTNTKIVCTFSVAVEGPKDQVKIDKVKIKISQRPDGTYNFTGCHED